jgi:UrcA family protein
MIRFVTLAAVAAFAVAAPAAAAPSVSQVRVSLAGKSAAQLDAEIAQAARSVCLRETAFETLIPDAYGRCVKATLKTAQAKLAAAQSAD